MRFSLTILFSLTLTVVPRVSLALLDLSTTDPRAAGIADLASSSGAARPVDTTVQPLDDEPFLDAYRALERHGLTDDLGRRTSRWSEARADGALHLEFLRPQVKLRAYAANDDAVGRLLYHSGGDRLSSGFILFANVTGAAFWGNRIGGEYDVQLNLGGGTTGHVKRLYLKGEWGKWSLKLGRDTERLGVGCHGTLLLDDNAPPLDLFRVRTEEPLFLPGRLERFGGFRFMFFLSRLTDPDPSPFDVRYGTGIDAVPDPNLMGMRLSYHPVSWFDLGLSRMAMYGGRGRETYDSPRDWWELLTATHENVDWGDDHRYDNDQYMTFDLTARLPILNGMGPLKGGKVYWEHGGTDFNAPWEGDGWHPLIIDLIHNANVAGLYLTTAVTDLRVEYAQIHKEWYRHHQYSQGYTYRGRPLGHPMGGDSRGWFLETSRHFGSTWRATGNLAFEERGRSLPSVEKRTEVGLRFEQRSFVVAGVHITAALDTVATRIRNALDSPSRDNRSELYVGALVSLEL